MREAGFVRVSFGIESGDPEILRVIKKDTNPRKLRLAYRAARGAGDWKPGGRRCWAIR